MSADLAELYKALAAFQAEVPVIPKSKVAEVQTRAGGTYRYNFADLADLLRIALPLASKHGLCLYQTVAARDGVEYLITTLAHVSGGTISSEYTIGPDNLDMQSRGSRLTYARRYSAAAILGLAPDDDTDAIGTEAPAKPPRRPPAKPEQASAATEDSEARLHAAIASAKSITALDKFALKPDVRAAYDALDAIQRAALDNAVKARKAKLAADPVITAASGNSSPANTELIRHLEPDANRHKRQFAALVHQPRFQQFARERYAAASVVDEPTAIVWFKAHLGIESRSVLDTDAGRDAVTAMHDLKGEFEAWDRG